MTQSSKTPMTSRDEALARVLEYRRRARSRSAAARVGLAILGGALLLAAVPLIGVLPEVGIPALLLGLRLLAVEADWAANAYAWINWRFARARDWFRRQPEAPRAGGRVGVLLLAVGLGWLLIHEVP